LQQVVFFKQIVERLEALQIDYCITGSVASNYWGTPRLTHDIDIIVVFAIERVGQMVRAFSSDFYMTEEAAHLAAVTHGMVNVLDPTHGFKADLWHVSADPFNHTMLARRLRAEVFPRISAWIAAPEDVLLHKLVWNKITPSDRQLMDAAGIAAVQEDKLDLEYLRDWATRQGTLTQLEEVLAGKWLKAT
jgi:hypothetical protein